MRMRKKPNLVPRMQRCAATMITEPEALRGRWLEQFPGHRALQLELGCGKGRFTATPRRRIRIFFSPRSRKCRTRWSSAWSA